jgi:hypothetical protein
MSILLPRFMRKSALEPNERELRNEARALQMGGDPATAKRFIAVANAMGRPEKLRQQYIESHANPLLSEILGEPIEGPDAEGEELWDEGRRNVDFSEIKQNPENYYDAAQRAKLLQMFSDMERGRGVHSRAQEKSQNLLSQLIQDDPSKFFTDRRQDEHYNLEPSANISFEESEKNEQRRAEERQQAESLQGWDKIAYDEQQRMMAGRNPNQPGDEITQVGKGTPMDLAWGLLKQNLTSVYLK